MELAGFFVLVVVGKIFFRLGGHRPRLSPKKYRHRYYCEDDE